MATLNTIYDTPTYSTVDQGSRDSLSDTADACTSKCLLVSVLSLLFITSGFFLILDLIVDFFPFLFVMRLV